MNPEATTIWQAFGYIAAFSIPAIFCFSLARQTWAAHKKGQNLASKIAAHIACFICAIASGIFLALELRQPRGEEDGPFADTLFIIAYPIVSGVILPIVYISVKILASFCLWALNKFKTHRG